MASKVICICICIIIGSISTFASPTTFSANGNWSQNGVSSSILMYYSQPLQRMVITYYNPANLLQPLVKEVYDFSTGQRYSVCLSGSSSACQNEVYGNHMINLYLNTSASTYLGRLTRNGVLCDVYNASQPDGWSSTLYFAVLGGTIVSADLSKPNMSWIFNFTNVLDWSLLTNTITLLFGLPPLCDPLKCNANVDVMILFDTSSGAGPLGVLNSEGFTSNIAGGLPYGRYGAISFDASANLISNLTSFPLALSLTALLGTSILSTAATVDGLPSAIDLANLKALTPNRLSSFPQSIVIITSHQPNDTTAAYASAAAARLNGITIQAVGVGSNVTSDFLNQISGGLYLQVSDYTTLTLNNSVLAAVLRNICMGPTQSPCGPYCSGASCVCGQCSTNITTSAVTSSAISTSRITSSAVTSASVTSARITSSAVTSSAITSSAITSAAITSAAITSAEITSAAITTAEITSAAITTAEITSAEITSMEITSSEITSSEVTSSEMTTSEITSFAISSSEITSSPLTSADFTTDSITSAAITTNQITSSALSTSRITSSPLTTSSITSSRITSSRITSSAITSASLTTGAMTTSALTSSELTTAAVTSSEITSSELTTQEFTSSDLTTQEFTSSDLTTQEFTSSELTSSELTSSELTSSELTSAEMTSSEITTDSITSSYLTTSFITSGLGEQEFLHSKSAIVQSTTTKMPAIIGGTIAAVVAVAAAAALILIILAIRKKREGATNAAFSDAPDVSQLHDSPIYGGGKSINNPLYA